MICICVVTFHVEIRFGWNLLKEVKHTVEDINYFDPDIPL